MAGAQYTSVDSTALKVRVADIVDLAAKLSRLRAEVITGNCRVAHVIRVRQACYAVGYRCGHSMSHVGRFIGNRDHSTISHGINVAGIYAERDPLYREFIERLHRAAVGAFAEEQEAEATALREMPPLPKFILFPKPQQQKLRNDFHSAEQPDGWQSFHDNVIAGSAALAAAILEAQAA